MKLPVLIGTALVAASGFAFAQAPQGDERKAKAREMHAKAAKACEASKDKREEYRECMRRELCAQTKDPAKCEAQAKEAMARRDKIREACKDKQGDARRACIREHAREHAQEQRKK